MFVSLSVSSRVVLYANFWIWNLKHRDCLLLIDSLHRAWLFRRTSQAREFKGNTLAGLEKTKKFVKFARTSSFCLLLHCEIAYFCCHRVGLTSTYALSPIIVDLELSLIRLKDLKWTGNRKKHRKSDLSISASRIRPSITRKPQIALRL